MNMIIASYQPYYNASDLFIATAFWLSLFTIIIPIMLSTIHNCIISNIDIDYKNERRCRASLCEIYTGLQTTDTDSDQSSTEYESRSRTVSYSDTESNYMSDTESDTDTESNYVSDTESESIYISDTESESESSYAPESDSDSSYVSDTESESETESDSDSIDLAFIHPAKRTHVVNNSPSSDACPKLLYDTYKNIYNSPHELQQAINHQDSIIRKLKQRVSQQSNDKIRLLIADKLNLEELFRQQTSDNDHPSGADLTPAQSNWLRPTRMFSIDTEHKINKCMNNYYVDDSSSEDDDGYRPFAPHIAPFR